MIKYNGIITINNAKYLVMTNDLGSSVQIPLDDNVAILISQHIRRIAVSKSVERETIPPSE